MPVVLEAIVVVAALAAAGVALRAVWRPATPAPVAPTSWAPHVAVSDNDTVVTVRRGTEALEIARIAGDDPQWHDKLLDARAEAALRANALNTPD